MRIVSFLNSVVRLTFVISLGVTPAENIAAGDMDWLEERWDRMGWSQWKRLQYYKEHYSPEVFKFCDELHGGRVSRIGSCVNQQQGIKSRIIRNARVQLGSQSLAVVLYNDCLDYYPLYGVARIGRCVETRLELRDRVKNEAIETQIYQKCEDKWRKHGFRAIHNCCMHEGRYFRERGELRD